MNIFAFDPDPALCARWLDNKRVGKLLMEANQMLSLAVKILDEDLDWIEHVGQDKICNGFAYRDHPVSIWVRSSRGNFRWTVSYAHALTQEFNRRFRKNHASGQRTPYIAEFEYCLPVGDLTPFQNSARHGGRGLDFSHLPVHQAYRTYAVARWKTDARPPQWPTGQMPEWALDGDINRAAIEALVKAGHPIYA